MTSLKGHSRKMVLTDLYQPETYAIGVVTSEWNASVTDLLQEAALERFNTLGLPASGIKTIRVPGSFELVSGAQILLETGKYDAILCLGCVIQGETRHFEFISNAVAQGIMDLSIRYKRPVIFGVLTTDTLEQAYNRSGGAFGNKGAEAAETALAMVSLAKTMTTVKTKPLGFI